MERDHRRQVLLERLVVFGKRRHDEERRHDE
jgi:hypothetical protein